MTENQQKLIDELVNKGLDGDMDAVNAHQDRMVRAKAKSMIMKIQKGILKRPPLKKISPEEVPNGDIVQNQEKKENKQESTSAKVVRKLLEKFPNEIENEEFDTHIQLKPDKWFEIATWLKSEPELFFDSLQCQMGIDVQDDILESRYNLHSMKHNHYVELRIAVSRSNAKIPSVEKIWRVADWFERETYDMLGIEYIGHSDLRRILLPDDWEGWPLRKDYQEQETYHGIIVPKMKEGWE